VVPFVLTDLISWAWQHRHAEPQQPAAPPLQAAFAQAVDHFMRTAPDKQALEAKLRKLQARK
jgi:hypothetical protein